MSHHDHDHEEEDPGWTPKGAAETFNDFKIWDHGVWPVDINHGNQEPEDG